MATIGTNSFRVQYVTCEYFDDITEEEFDVFYNLCEQNLKSMRTKTLREFENVLSSEGFRTTEIELLPQFNPNFDRDAWIEVQLNLIDSKGRRCYVTFKNTGYIGTGY